MDRDGLQDPERRIEPLERLSLALRQAARAHAGETHLVAVLCERSEDCKLAIEQLHNPDGNPWELMVAHDRASTTLGKLKSIPGLENVHSRFEELRAAIATCGVLLP